jgi:cellulose synthase/poly-beta-1,6-N-acetylglucosamine synthase-like glycosyltransferase
MVWQILAWTVALATGIPLLYFALEVLTGIRPSARSPCRDLSGASVVVLIPAHDEENGIAATVHGVQEATDQGTRILVVADNCSDQTAARARRAGAEVVERIDPSRQGKGHALAFGRQALQASPPDVVIVLDADCALNRGGVRKLAARAIASDEPVQAINLQSAAAGTSPLIEISNFAMLVKNLVRARGLCRLSGGTLLFGTGMAFPWRIFTTAELGNAEIVEDTRLGLALARSGVRVRLEEGARVTSAAAALHDSFDQRKRWEHGFLQTALTQAFPLIIFGVRHRSRQCLFLGAHLFVPPLALLFLISGLVLALLLLFYIRSGLWTPGAFLLTALLAASAAVLMSWHSAGRAMVGLRSLLLAPLYVAWKIPLYVGFLLSRQAVWNRTRRASQHRVGESSETK